MDKFLEWEQLVIYDEKLKNYINDTITNKSGDSLTQEQKDALDMLKNDGNGDKALFDDGTYKEINKSIQVLATLSASAWSGETQTLSVPDVKITSNGIVGLSITCTKEQRKQARSACLSIIEQRDGTITIVADGVIPTVDIPLSITILE